MTLNELTGILQQVAEQTPNEFRNKPVWFYDEDEGPCWVERIILTPSAKGIHLGFEGEFFNG